MSLRRRGYLSEKADRKRLPKYGEVYRKSVAGGDATVIVRGIWQSQLGDSYHVRVLRGKGDSSDEYQNKRKAILWKDDHYLERNLDGDLTHQQLLKKAVKSAMAWIRSAAGKKKIARAKSL